MPELAPLRQVPPGSAPKGGHSSPSLKARGFLACLVNLEGVVLIKEISFTDQITVKWELYDQEKREIIYSKRTSGTGDSIISAFEDSFRELLTSKGLVRSIEKHLHD